MVILQKRGVHEFSRALKSLTYTNASENPMVSVIGRLICSQVNNAAFVRRVSIVKRNGSLPDTDVYRKVENHPGYNALRRKVSRCCSFADFARRLAEEFYEKYKNSTIDAAVSREVTDFNTNASVSPLYKRNIVAKYNRQSDRERRMSNIEAHIKKKEKECVLQLMLFVLCVRGRRENTKDEEGPEPQNSTMSASKLFATHAGYPDI